MSNKKFVYPTDLPKPQGFGVGFKVDSDEDNFYIENRLRFEGPHFSFFKPKNSSEWIVDKKATFSLMFSTETRKRRKEYPEESIYKDCNSQTFTVSNIPKETLRNLANIILETLDEIDDPKGAFEKKLEKQKELYQKFLNESNDKP